MKLFHCTDRSIDRLIDSNVYFPGRGWRKLPQRVSGFTVAPCQNSGKASCRLRRTCYGCWICIFQTTRNRQSSPPTRWLTWTTVCTGRWWWSRKKSSRRCTHPISGPVRGSRRRSVRVPFRRPPRRCMAHKTLPVRPLR